MIGFLFSFEEHTNVCLNCNSLLLSGILRLTNPFLNHGGHKPGKHEKPGKLKEFEKLLKTQRNLNLFRKNLENSKYVI